MWARQRSRARDEKAAPAADLRRRRLTCGGGREEGRRQQPPVTVSPHLVRGLHCQEGKKKMDPHHVQQQQYVDPYRTMVLSPQPDHLNALQYNQQQPTSQATPPPPQHHHASLASHFHLLHLMTRLADAIGKGTRNQHSDALVEDLTSQFARCQQLLNSISGTLSSKSILKDKGKVWKKRSSSLIRGKAPLKDSSRGIQQDRNFKFWN
uniref:Uncharacterized protein n=1 Tax=Leersia perrieri TaxID=77586 RepID=A0A0D9XEE1_9ORYZ